jgi:triacylglycerol lipase
MAPCLLGICRFQGALPLCRGSALVAQVGYALNSVIASYPEFEGAIRATLTPRGEDLLSKVADQRIAETVAKFMFRHPQPYFNEDICQLVDTEPFRTLFDMQRIGGVGPNAFRTNEEPPFVNKLVINHALPMLVDGEAAMQWIVDRFNGVPTTPNRGQF